MDHLIQLPHLRTWRIEGPLPNYSPSSLPLVFPSLTEFTIGEDVQSGWISLLERLEGGISATRGTTPLSRVKNSLAGLKIKPGPSGPVVDVSFTSKVQMFRGLVDLNFGSLCPGERWGANAPSG